MIGMFAAFVIGGYLLGAIPTGLVVGRVLKGVDIREYGSGKTGTTNTLRTLGLGPAIVVLLVDMLKGVLPVLVAKLVTGDPRVEVAGALAAIIGHDWPAYAGFRGGRGVATSFGATVAMMPPLGLVLSILGAAITAVIVVLLAATGRVPVAYAVFGVAAATLIVALHRSNIARLLAGTEPKLGQGGERRRPALGSGSSKFGNR